MANIYYGNEGEIVMPTLLLQRRDFKTIGQLKYVHDFTYKENFNAPNEISFSVYKNDYSDEDWEKISDFKVLRIKEICDGTDEAFQITISSNTEVDETKDIVGTSLAECELSQTKINNTEINTENDMLRDDYDSNFPAVFYRNQNISSVNWSDSKYNGKYTNYSDEKKKKTLQEGSLIHRILEKVPNYSIIHVDESLVRLKQISSFSIDNTDIYSELTGEIADEYGVLFKFDSINRTISCYDLYNTCHNCGYRGDFIGECPECGSKSYSGMYGKDTDIFVSKENLSTQISLSSNNDSVKNCFYVEGGDDLINATIRLVNPNGSNYIYNFSDDDINDMPNTLVSKIRSYDNTYEYYYKTKTYSYSSTKIQHYNDVIKNLNNMFPENTYSIFSKNYLTGYENVIKTYYDTIDASTFMQHNMMPTARVEMNDIDSEIALLTVSNIGRIAVNNTTLVTKSSAENALLGMLKCIINTALYDISLETTTVTKSQTKDGNAYWTGVITLTAIGVDSTDLDYTRHSNTLTITITGDIKEFISQKMQKAVNKIDVSELNDITKVDTTLTPDSSEEKKDIANFKEKLGYYGITPLNTILNAFQSCLTAILQVRDSCTQENREICDKFYTAYYKRQYLVSQAIYQRDIEYNYIIDIKNDILKTVDSVHKDLDFKNYIGDNLWNLFLSYRREERYTNSNYISDGEDNEELIKNAKQLLDLAKRELKKASTKVYTITSSLYNLLAIDAFKPLKTSFSVGNYIRIRVDNTVFKLRLLSYQLNYSDLSDIQVEFSTATKYNMVSDIKSVLESAASIAGSYQYVVQQVQDQVTGYQSVEKWREEGLDATLVKIVNDAETQSVTVDSNGILCRTYDDVTQSYEGEQLRLINKGLYITDDNWEHLKTAVGSLIYIDPDTKEEYFGYGINAEVLIGDMVMTKTLRVHDQNNTVIIDKDGITLKGGQIKWDSKISTDNLLDQYGRSLSEHLNQADNMIESYNQDTDPKNKWSSNTYYLHVGDLWYNPTTGLTKQFSSSFTWKDTTDKTLIEIARGGVKVFTGDPNTHPTTPYFKGDVWVQGKTGEMMHCINTRVSGNYVSSDWTISTKYPNDIADTKKEIEEFKNKINNDIFSTTITDKSVISPYIGGGYLYIAKGGNSVEINPLGTSYTGKSGNIFEVKSGNKSLFYVDTQGNGVFSGELSAAIGTFSGSVSVNNGSFKINTDGSMSVGNGKLAIHSDGSISINQGKFGVSSTGELTTSSNINSNGNIYNNGYIYSKGTISSNGEIISTGALSAAKGRFIITPEGNITIKDSDGNEVLKSTVSSNWITVGKYFSVWTSGKETEFQVQPDGTFVQTDSFHIRPDKEKDVLTINSNGTYIQTPNVYIKPSDQFCVIVNGNDKFYVGNKVFVHDNFYVAPDGTNDRLVVNDTYTNIYNNASIARGLYVKADASSNVLIVQQAATWIYNSLYVQSTKGASTTSDIHDVIQSYVNNGTSSLSSRISTLESKVSSLESKASS